MRRSCGVLVVALALSWVAAAAAERPNPQDTLKELKERARTARPEDATMANIRVVQQEIEIAEQLFKDGDVDKGQATVDEAVHYAELAGAAVQKRSKNLKKAEIILRESARRLQDIRRTLAFEDQAPVQKAEDQLERIRHDLLAQMFAPEK